MNSTSLVRREIHAIDRPSHYRANVPAPTTLLSIGFTPMTWAVILSMVVTAFVIVAVGIGHIIGQRDAALQVAASTERVTAEAKRATDAATDALTSMERQRADDEKRRVAAERVAEEQRKLDLKLATAAAAVTPTVAPVQAYPPEHQAGNQWSALERIQVSPEMRFVMITIGVIVALALVGALLNRIDPSGTVVPVALIALVLAAAFAFTR
jgi:hypothetical protein